MGMVHWHNQMPKLEFKTRRWKGETTLNYPAATPAPTTAESIDAWVKAMPTVFAEQQRQAPLEAQQQLDLLKQYGLQYSQAGQAIDQALYPKTSAIQENLAGIVN